jgi:hypothetical protein
MTISIGSTSFNSVEASIQAAIDGMDDKEVEAKLIRAMNQIAEFTAERSVANAPILKGPLRADMQVLPARRVGDQIIAKVVNTTPYALKQHEDLGPPNVNPEGWMNLGPVSAVQPGTPEGGVGGKYIQRVVQYHLSRFVKFIQTAFERKG